MNTDLRRTIVVISAFILAGCGPHDIVEGSDSARDIDSKSRTAVSAETQSPPDLPVVFVAATAEDRSAITSPGLCSESMGAGGNYTEGRFELWGKCNGAGISPGIGTDAAGSHFLSFNVSPPRSVTGQRDRAELAFVDQYFPFYEPLYIGFRIMVPASSDVTNEFFYPLQLWQCAAQAPIAGLRIRRGTSHTLEFMTRNSRQGRTRTTFDLEPGRWHSFVLFMVPGPHDDALFAVLSESEVLVESRVPYGLGEADACGTEPNELRYRVKFGIYKGGEPGKRFSINYDDFTITARYEAVAAALGWNPDRELPSASN